MDVLVKPSSIAGSLSASFSKSLIHRALIATSLCSGISAISNITLSKDVLATLSALETLGATIEKTADGCLTIKGGIIKHNNVHIDCGDSATTLRLLMPIVAALGIKTTFTGKATLFRRPLDVYIDIFKKHNVDFEFSFKENYFKINSQLKGKEFIISANLSSQFVSGLLFCLPLLSNDSKIILNSPLRSKPYVDLTLSVLKSFGISINSTLNGFYIKGNQQYKSTDFEIEGDWSQASYFIVMGLKSGLEIKGLNPSSIQGDRSIINTINNSGGCITCDDNKIKIKKSKIKGFTVDIKDTPDLAPALAVLACIADGTSRILGAGRLKYKESNRLKSIKTSLNRLGAKITAMEDSLSIEGIACFKGGAIDSFNDHRIVMAAVCASIYSENDILISNAHAVDKSYPAFFDDFKKLGGLLKFI